MENQQEEKMESVESKGKKTRKINNKMAFLLGIGAVLLILLGGFCVFVVKGLYNLSDSPYVMKTAKILGLPVASIDGVPVYYTDFMEDYTTLRKFYAEQASSGLPVTSDEEISDQVLSRLLVNNIVKKYAKELNTTVEDTDIAEVKKGLVDQFPNEEEAEKELMDRYGWNMEMYTKKIIIPLLLEQKTSDAFSVSEKEEWSKYNEEQIRARHILFMVNDEKEDAKVKKLAESVLKRIKDGEDFGALAEEFGSDSTAQNGGDLGWFARGLMVPEFEEAVFALNAGQVGEELVKSRYGYHIVRTDEKRTAKNFSAFLDDELEKSKIKIHFLIHNPFEVVETEIKQENANVENKETSTTEEN